MGQRVRDGDPPDATFGSSGEIVTSFGSWDNAYAMAIQPDGKAVLAGDSNIDFAVARYKMPQQTGGLEERTWYLHDANHNVTSVADAFGIIAERYAFTSYGQRTVLDANWSADGDGQSDRAVQHAFQGLREDPLTGLHDARFRPYHATLGRPTSRDPIGYADGMNLGQWVRSGPTNRVDPFGLLAPLPAAPVVAAAAPAAGFALPIIAGAAAVVGVAVIGYMFYEYVIVGTEYVAAHRPTGGACIRGPELAADYMLRPLAERVADMSVETILAPVPMPRLDPLPWPDDPRPPKPPRRDPGCRPGYTKDLPIPTDAQLWRDARTIVDAFGWDGGVTVATSVLTDPTNPRCRKKVWASTKNRSNVDMYILGAELGYQRVTSPCADTHNHAEHILLDHALTEAALRPGVRTPIAPSWTACDRGKNPSTDPRKNQGCAQRIQIMRWMGIYGDVVYVHPDHHSL